MPNPGFQGCRPGAVFRHAAQSMMCGETVKAAPFEYLRPLTVDAALAALAQHEDARVIAGGQTLAPMMAMRLARPSHLVDIAHIPALKGIGIRDGAVWIGAAVRQLEAERSELVQQNAPLLAAAFPWIGHHATRARGTVGGSIANADPAAEIPLVLTALDGAVHWANASGDGATSAREFFTGPMMTALDAAGIVTGASFPVWTGARIGASLHEVSQRRSDFAYVSAAAQIQLDAHGLCTRAALAIGGATPAPVALQEICAALRGAASPQAAQAALERDVAALEIMRDGHASPRYRRHNALTLAQRALADAFAKAAGGAS